MEKGCDVLLVVVEPSKESIEIAARIAAMVRNLGKGIYYVLNKVTKQTKSTLLNALPKDGVIGSIPNDERIFNRGLSGSELDLELAGIKEIAGFLDAKNRSPYAGPYQ